MMRDLHLSRIEGISLFLLLFVYLAYLIIKKDTSMVEEDEISHARQNLLTGCCCCSHLVLLLEAVKLWFMEPLVSLSIMVLVSGLLV